MYTRRVYDTPTRPGVTYLIHSGAQHLALVFVRSPESRDFRDVRQTDDHRRNNSCSDDRRARSRVKNP
jgi:hypothetical protein